jgi:hypothetical protein
MKLYPFLALLLSFTFFGCASNLPPPPKPFMGIGTVKQIGDGPRELAKYDVTINYNNIVPDKYEVKVGFGYTSTDEGLKSIAPGGHGFYAIAESEVLHQPEGQLHLTLEPTVVRNLGGKLDGRIHAILSKYPHGKEWLIESHDIFVLPIHEP